VNEISDQELLQQAYKAQQSARNELDKEAPQEDEQGFLGDAVDAFQHGVISGGADLADAGRYLGGSETAGNIADSLRESANDQLSQMSTSGRDAMQKFAILDDDGEFSMKGLGLNVASMIGGLVPTMIPGGLAAKGLSAAGKVAGATGKVAKATDIASDAAGFGLVGGAASGGSVGNQAYETIMSATPNELKEAPAYREQYLALREQGADHKTAMYQARENVARTIAGDAAKDGALLGAVTQGALGPVFGKLFRGEAGSFSKSISTGALAESGQEFVESGGQRMIANANVNNAIPTELTDGALNDAVTGAVLGGIAGGTFGGAGRVVRSVRGGVHDTNTAPQDQLKEELERVEQNLKTNAGSMSREDYTAAVELRDSLLNELNEFNSAADTESENQDNTEDQRLEGVEENEQIEQPEEAYQSQLDNPAFQARRARELDRRFSDDQPFDMAGPQQSDLQEPSSLGLPAPNQTTVIPERVPPNSEAVSYSQINSEDAFLDAPSLRPERRQQQEGRERRTNQRTEFSTPQQSVIAEPYQPTETELAARETTRRSFEEPVTEARQSRKVRDEAYQLQKQQEQQLERSRQEQRQRNVQRRNQENQVALGQLEVGNQVKAAKGAKAKAYTPSNQALDVEYQVVEANDLTTSHDDNFQARADYPQALQNRDRSSPALRKQVEDNAKNLIPEKLGEDSGVVSGAPIVRNGVVESGNGRTMSIRRAYNDNGATNYRQYLEDNAERLGINKDDLSQFNQPVLVRQRLSDMTAEELTSYTKDANTTDAFALNPVEQAKSDANRVSDDDMTLIDIPDSGDFAAASNRAFVRKFLSRYPKAEQNAMLNGDGTISEGGVNRIQNAIFAKAYGSDQLIEDITTTSADDMKTIAKALTNAAPEVAKLNAQGGVDGFTDTIVNAVNLVKRSRRDGTPVQELTNQFDLMSENTVDQATASLANFLDQNVRSIKRMTDAIKGAAKRGQEAKSRAQSDDLFGSVPEPTTDDLLNIDGSPAGQSGKQISETGKASPEVSEIKAEIGKQNDDTVASGNADLTETNQPLPQLSSEPEIKVQKSGRPYSSEKVARMSQTFKNTPNAEVVPHKGGFGIVSKYEGNESQEVAPSNQQASIPPSKISSQNISESVAETPAQQPPKEERSVRDNESDNQNIEGNTADKQTNENEPNLSVSDNTGGMKADDVRAAVDPLINDLHERGTFEVVQSINDLPFAIRLQAKAKLKQSKGESPVLRGINAGDKNYLIADGLRNEKEVVEIFLHEVVGHKAVLDMLGKDGDAIMERIALSYGRKGLKDLIKTYGVEPNTKEGRILLGKEKVAHMAERGEKPALLKRLVAKVKSWLRNYFPSIKWSDNDVLSMISNARDNVENRYMVKVDLDAETDTSTQEDSVNLSITDRFKEKIAKRDRDQEPVKPDTTFDKVFKTLGQKDKTVYQKFKDEAKRQFKAGGMLPDSAFSEKIKRDSHMNASELEIGAHLGSFRKAVKKAYGKEYKELPEKVRQELNRQMSSTEVNKLVPFSVRLELMKMRATIKGLSKEYADVLQQDIDDLRESGNDVAAESKAELLQTILNNMDTYAHRSYRAFDNPEWPKQVPKDVFRRAVDHIKSRYTDGTDTEKEERAVRAARSILEEGTAYQDMGSFIKESKLGAKDLSTLKRRKEIAPEIRELLGEYHDVEVNFAKTVSKMSHLVANHKFLKRLYEIGTTEGFFFTEENRPLDKSVVKIAADGSDVMAPLNGLYTYPEIEKAFREALGKEGDMPLWVSIPIRINGVVKYSKTVLSPTTAMRNIWSAFFFAVANGHFDISQMRKSLSVRSEYFGGDTKAANLDYLKRLKKLGVIYDTPYAGEMMDLLQDSRIEELMTNKKVFSTFTKLNDFAQKFYQYGDDMWKIMGWENEKAMLMKHKGMSEADAEVAAAERIRNTYPTYSMTGRFTQSLRRFPLAGTFVSFPAEIIRTSYHMLRYLKQDFKDSPAYAARKVAGLALVSSLAFAAQGVSKALMGMDDDEEEAVREMAPPWSKNSNLMFIGRDDKGNIQYLDMSFLDPYNYFKRPINAILREQPFQDAATQSASEMLTPFFGVDITSGTVAEVWNNKKDSGGKVFNEQDTVTGQAVDIANHLRKNLQPGFANNIERMYKAMSGEKSASGKEYTVPDEMAALVGFRASTVDPKTALYYRSFDFKQSKSDAAKMLKDLLKEQNDVSLNDLKGARDAMLKAREQTYTKMIRLVKAAKKSGMSMVDIRRVLKLSGVSAKDIRALVMGKIPIEDDYTKMARSISRRASILYGEEAGQEVMERARSLRD